MFEPGGTGGRGRAHKDELRRCSGHGGGGVRHQEAKEWRRCPMDGDEKGSEEEAKGKFKQRK